MPFKSKAQRAKFHVLLAQGKMSQATIDDWEKDTPKKLPERIGPKKKDSKHSRAHWQDYFKRTKTKTAPRIKRMKKTAMDYFKAGFEKNAGFAIISSKHWKDQIKSGLIGATGTGIGAAGVQAGYNALTGKPITKGLGMAAGGGAGLGGAVGFHLPLFKRFQKRENE